MLDHGIAIGAMPAGLSVLSSKNASMNQPIQTSVFSSISANRGGMPRREFLAALRMP